MQTINLDKPNRNTGLLAPFFEARLLKALDACKEAGLPLAVFEAYRSPDRQQHLFSQGRTREGKIVTRARAWESFHNVSMAADLVFYRDKVWSWEGDWDKAHDILHSFGFETLSFEKPHVQITGGLSIDEAVRIAKSQGALALWSVVEQRLK